MTADTIAKLTVFAATFCALYVGHHFGDHWVQTHRQACGKGAPGWTGRIWCTRHVLTLTITKLVALLALNLVTGLDIHIGYLAAALAVDAVSHYWADRRFTLAGLATRLGKADFYQLGAPRPGHDDQPHLGTGAYTLDQSFHILWLFIAALIMTGGS
ncbi:DUF3307 domain-containing protein [Nonomuraea sp. NPDC050643]|uniref:DUF3307 domain-containing protein n=1 Tax=Nonomuraea sp. NPDC050643 TaxID=3155660 RepID=UPI0033DEEF75